MHVQGLDLGTTPGRDAKQNPGNAGMVKRLISMFKGEHPAQVLGATHLEKGSQPRCAHTLDQTCSLRSSSFCSVYGKASEVHFPGIAGFTGQHA